MHADDPALDELDGLDRAVVGATGDGEAITEAVDRLVVDGVADRLLVADRHRRAAARHQRHAVVHEAVVVDVLHERPAEGHVLDREGQMPQTYAAERAPTAFERELWARFWELANDPEEAKRRGVRALHGEAVSTRLRKDRSYTITLRSTGELTIQPAP